MPRKTMRVRDVCGRWVDIEPNDVCPPPIRRKALKRALLERIGFVHEALHDLLLAPNDAPLSLEQFEVGFLRSQSALEELKVWEAIVIAMEKAQVLLPSEKYDRRALYRRLLFMLCAALTDSEADEHESRILVHCFNSSFSSPHSASPARVNVTPVIGKAANATICFACYCRVGRASATFCPRCGKRLVAPP